jgi:hypothetical protein
MVRPGWEAFGSAADAATGTAGTVPTGITTGELGTVAPLMLQAHGLVEDIGPATAGITDAEAARC